ncbi:unnamed protein product [Aureobasidium pullulans]|nr:unnamed protein product [Aureobasidium pullulans]
MANATSGFSTINFAAPGASPAAAVPSSAQTPPGSEGQYSTPDDNITEVPVSHVRHHHMILRGLPKTGPNESDWILVTAHLAAFPPLFPRPGLPEPVGSSFSPYDQPSPGASYMSVNSAPSPLTPGSSSAHASPGLRRLSVNYLLSGPAGDHASPRSSYDRFGGYRKVEDGCTIYGYDYGLPDLDIPKNDDNGAINPQTPAASMQSPSLSDAAWSPSQLYESPLEKPAFERVR